jgi:hypothetical protein
MLKVDVVEALAEVTPIFNLSHFFFGDEHIIKNIQTTIIYSSN